MYGISAFLFSWYNLPFTLMILVCIVIAGMQWIGLGGEQEQDAHAEVHADVDHDVDLHADVDHNVDLHADVDHDVDMHADVDHDVDLHADMDHDLSHDVDHELSHEVDHEVDHDVSHEAGHAGGDHESPFSLLAYVGAGRAPLMIVLLILFGTVGLLGWAFNGIVRGVFGVFPGMMLGLTLPAALVVGAMVSGRISRLIGQVLPPFSTTAVSERALVGRRATVTSPWIDNRSGQVRVRDTAGTMITLFAVTQNGTPIKFGEEVVLKEWIEAKKVFVVEKNGLGEGARAPGQS